MTRAREHRAAGRAWTKSERQALTCVLQRAAAAHYVINKPLLLSWRLPGEPSNGVRGAVPSAWRFAFCLLAAPAVFARLCVSVPVYL